MFTDFIFEGHRAVAPRLRSMATILVMIEFSDIVDFEPLQRIESRIFFLLITCTWFLGRASTTETIV